ncbi:MAG: hypothetical protein FJY88_11200, partial [Candidatus Eisenbacteria bacterium]|nr:hypothetical protein [Candidatus Eisenbacteria bacterium]
MRRLLLTLLLSAVLAGAALAGVNQNGAIIVHTNDAYTYSSGTRCTTALARPATCEATITRTDRSTTRSVLWFLWAFLPSATPRVTTVYFGMNMDMTCLDPTEFTWAWCSPTGVTPSQDVSGGWPGDGESATVGWPVAITQNLYPFMVIRAGVEQCGAPSTAHICSSINHVGGYAAFVDDSNPPQTDLVTNFGCVRWYQPGVVNCPQALSTGACCFLDGHCELLSQAACEGSPGVLRFLGTGTACEPTNPCPQPGACCNVSTGVCSFTLAELCIPPDFQFIGEGVACTPSPCPLPPPTLQTPLNGATCQSIAGSLTWSDVPDAVGYTVQIGTSCGTGTEYSVGGASYAYSGLLYNTTYHWRVKTRNVVGGHGPYSDCFSFTTLGAPLAAPALLTPANGATCVILPVTLDWADVTGATGYRLRIGATCGAGTEYDVTSSEYVAALNPGTRYFWQVKAKDGCNQYGPYSACYELRTLPSPLPSPVLIFPPNGETGRPTASYLAWDSVPGAAGYKVQIGTSCGSGDEFEVTGPSYDYSGLTEGALYYWRVKTKDSCNQYGNYSECFSFTTALPVLPPPTLETPADGALCQATSGILNWADVGGAVAGYMVQLGTSCGSGPEVEVGPSQYAYSGLDPATVYHWRVKTKNAQEVYGQYSDCFSFTTLPAPLGAPTLLSPADGAVGQPLAGTLDWSDVGGAAGYVVRIGTGCGSGDEYEVASSSYAYSGLAAGTTYFWQVKTKDSCGQFGGYSGCFSFSTSGVSLPPPTLLAPADGATCEAVSGMLDWTDVGGAAAYMVQLGTSCGSGAEVEVGSSQYAYSGLTAGTTYHWRVKTKNAQGEYGSYSNCFSFTTLLAPLGAPALLSPGDGADCQALSGTLDWTDVPAAVAYTVQLGTSCGSGAEVEVGSSQYAYSALTAGTTYHWRVKTKDACGQYGSYSSCFSFTTLPAPLGAPTLLSPADGAVGQPLAGTLDWSDVGGAAGYMVRLGTGCGAGTEYEVASSSYAYSGLAAGVTYFWQVKAKDNCGQFGSYSGCFSFSTSGVSLPPPTLLAPADGATCEAVSGMLDWTDVGGAAAYMVQLGTSCGSGAEVEVGSSQYAYSGLTAGTTYHWRVKTKNA